MCAGAILTMTIHWYALKSHPHKEELLYHQVGARGFEAYYPRIRVQPVNPRSRKIRPYFPGYLFVRVDLDAVGISIFQWMPYASGLVSFGGEPAVVPDSLVSALEQKISGINAVGGELFSELKQGTPVEIQGGPFEGYEAIFDTRLPGSERVRVLLKMLNNQSIKVELPAGQITPRKNQPKK